MLTNIHTEREEDRLEGREEGLAEARAEGREEGMIESAQKLKAMGVDTAIIMHATGLTAEFIEQLELFSERIRINHNLLSFYCNYEGCNSQ